MKISLLTLFVLTSILAIAVASVTVNPIVGMGLGIILLPTMIGLWIAAILTNKYGNTTPPEQESDAPNKKVGI